MFVTGEDNIPGSLSNPEPSSLHIFRSQPLLRNAVDH
jgi:hypothetical protein